MIDYFAESRLVATVKVSGNIQRTLGVALSLFHRESSAKIKRLEMLDTEEARWQIAILHREIDEAAKWESELSRFMSRIRAEKEAA